jgi:outer membrane protein
MKKQTRLAAQGFCSRGRSAFAAIAVAAISATCMPPAWAQSDEDKFQAGGSQWGLGIAAGMDRKPYREFDDKAVVIPMVTYENRWVSVAGPSLDLKLPSAGPVSFRLRARYASDGYEAEDSTYLTGMEERKASIWLGGTAIWRNEFANLSAELLADASGHSKGTRFKLQVDRRFTSGAFSFTPRVAVHWADRKYVGYYYGVRAAEARADRARYDGDAAANVELGLRVDYAVAPKQTLFLDLSGTSLGSGIKNSPLVGRSSQTGVRVGYLYRF